ENIKLYLTEEGYEVEDFGTESLSSCDYPDYAKKVADAIVRGSSKFGILICGTGIGMSIVANKTRGIRAALCTLEETAYLARSHNHANVLCLAARFLSESQAKQIVSTFLSTSEEEGRHRRRVDKIES
ncbi:ribose 5-phosphate isomerase B, partial [bacterium]|nr:ribose 5-phosphate isomerase B [bacterium]